MVRVALIAGGLVLAGCNEPPREAPPATTSGTQLPGQTSGALPDGRPPQSARPRAVDEPVQDASQLTAQRPEERHPLDLSMPPQPRVEMGSLEVERVTPRRLLPDLFEPQETSGAAGLSLKGRVLTNQTGREDLDAIQGGEIRMEMKTP